MELPNIALGGIMRSVLTPTSKPNVPHHLRSAWSPGLAGSPIHAWFVAYPPNVMGLTLHRGRTVSGLAVWFSGQTNTLEYEGSVPVTGPAVPKKVELEMVLKGRLSPKTGPVVPKEVVAVPVGRRSDRHVFVLVGSNPTMVTDVVHVLVVRTDVVAEASQCRRRGEVAVVRSPRRGSLVAVVTADVSGAESFV